MTLYLKAYRVLFMETQNTSAKRRTKCPICYQYRADWIAHITDPKHVIAVAKMRKIMADTKARKAR